MPVLEMMLEIGLQPGLESIDYPDKRVNNHSPKRMDFPHQPLPFLVIPHFWTNSHSFFVGESQFLMVKLC